MTTDRDQLREALERLRKSAAMLQQHAEGCAINHYGDDFDANGMPGWLADTRADIDAAAAALATSDQAVMDERERLREAREMLATVTPETKAACYDALTLDAVELGFPGILSALEALAAIRAQGEPK